ncbi:TonB-dependent siderophore receptor [Sphingomonas arantia]|uniref:TonB-dependent siderophore receptor n=1 Tax=Sphingomonas arantia TaxID=1460676 RepID=A0ABW4U1S2_9SPHN
MLAGPSLWSIAFFIAGASAFYPGSAGASTAAASGERGDDPQDQDIVVTGEKDERPTTSTKLPLTLKETPQSVTVVDRQRIEDFNLTSVTEVLAQTPGVTISSTDSNRTNFNIRGFAVRNFQFDGVPTIYQVSGYENSAVGDIAIYDRVEVIRGAAGLVTGVGDPSATVNLVRKRAPSEFRGYYSMQGGSFSSYRVEGDIGGPVTKDGSVRARIVAAYTDRESYIDLQHDRIPVLYGTIEWDVTPHTRLRVGADYLRTDSQGAGWGSIPLLYSDGTKTKFPRSFTGAAPWNQWLRETTTVFAAAEQDIGSNWLARVSYNGRRGQNDSTLFNIPNGFPNRDGTGLGEPFSFYGEVDQNEDSLDAYVAGKFKLFGREQEVVAGLNHFERDFAAGRTGFGATPVGYPTAGRYDIDPWNPTFGPPPIVRTDALLFSQDLRQTGGYGVVRLNPADWLKIIAGGRYTDFRADRNDYDVAGALMPDGPNSVQRARKWAPYGGVVADITSAVSLYASYASVFSPVSARDVNNDILPPTTGVNYEAGVKATPFGEGFTVSAAGFYIKQDNLTLTDPNGIPNSLPGNLTPSISVSGVKTRGGELELAGEPLHGWTVNGSYTYARTEDRLGVRVNPFFPLHVGRIYTTYRLLADRLTLGGGVTAQSRIFDRGNVPSGRFNANGSPVLVAGTVAQGAYATVDLLARYKLTERAILSVNVTNLLDQGYYRNVRFAFGGPGGFYSEPRRVVGSIRVSF